MYLAYGFAMLANFNSIISTLGFYTSEMPNEHPSFYVNFGYGLCIVIFVCVVILKGYLIPYPVKHHLMILLSIPLAISLPLAVKKIENEQSKLDAFLLILILIGFLNAFQ